MTNLSIIDRNGGKWLSATDLAAALGYKRADTVANIFRRNKDEFSADMSQNVNLTFSGNLQRTQRIFSLRGCHLIAMFSKTQRAKQFRAWVLDLLDKVSKPTKTLSPAHQRTLQNAAAKKVGNNRALP